LEDFQVDMTRIMKYTQKEQQAEKVKQKKVLKFLRRWNSKKVAMTEEERIENMSQKQIIKDVVVNFEEKHLIPAKIARKVQRIMEIENSFKYGFCETVKFNLDFIFRYLYFVAFMIQVATQFTT
jgi:hypothetical protein